MTGTLTVTAMQRFAELRRTFESMVAPASPPTDGAPRRKRSRGGRKPKRNISAIPERRTISAIQDHHIRQAASKQQIAETAIIERALGAKHDRGFIERLKIEVQQHLALAGVRAM